MLRSKPPLLGIATLMLWMCSMAPSVHAVIVEHLSFPTRIDGEDHQLEAMVYRPDDPGRYPLVIFSHGRNGRESPRDPNTAFGYREICQMLASEGRVVVFVVRRGYGNSTGLDRELKPTAVESGLEAAKDYRAALEYWRMKDFVLPDKAVLMGQSQGGWSVLAATNVAMEGVLGVVNISGGTNYALMGSGAVTPAVEEHWVAGSRELGAKARVPSFWIYAENDQSISGPTARRMFEAYTGAGGEASMLMLPPYGTNGHNIVVAPGLFINPLKDFFASIGFVPRKPQEAVANGDTSARIVNLSTRGIVSTGENVLIAGFVIAGTAPKKLLILASGLNLARRFGLVGEVGRPRVTISRSVAGQSEVIAMNNDWQTDAVEIRRLVSQVGAQPLSESSDPAHGDAGLSIVLAPGVYTAVVSPDAASANQDGVGLIEIYDVSPEDGSRLVNISSRGWVEAGARQMIVGVVVGGPGRSRLMIRSVGPGLRALGVQQSLGNPAQTLFRALSGQQAAVATNDNWWDSAEGDQIAMLGPKLGAFDLGASSADSVILRILEAGVYSSIVSSRDGKPGVVLTEIYDANVP